MLENSSMLQVFLITYDKVRAKISQFNQKQTTMAFDLPHFTIAMISEGKSGIQMILQSYN